MDLPIDSVLVDHPGDIDAPEPTEQKETSTGDELSFRTDVEPLQDPSVGEWKPSVDVPPEEGADFTGSPVSEWVTGVENVSEELVTTTPEGVSREDWKNEPAPEILARSPAESMRETSVPPAEEPVAEAAFADVMKDVPPPHSPASADEFERWLTAELEDPMMKRESFRTVQQSLDARPDPAFALRISWQEKKPLETVWKQHIHHWVKSSRKHLTAELLDLEKAVAYRLWKVLHRAGVPAHLVPLDRAGRPQRSQRAVTRVSFSAMGQAVYGYQVPEVPFVEEQPSDAKLKAQPFEFEIALPSYIGDKDLDLGKALAHRIVRLKAVENVAQCVSEFSWEIKNIDNQRKLKCSAVFWI